MSDITVARRYAQALYEEAARKNTVEKVDEDVALIGETLAGSRDLVQLFESPVVAREKKVSIVETLFGKRVQPGTLDFLKLLIEKQREDLLPVIVRGYRDLRDQQLGIVEATARVAQPLGEAEEKALVQALEKKTGKRIRLQVEHDPALIGGLVIRVGDVVYDGSVQHQLDVLREQMEHGAYLGNGAAA